MTSALMAFLSELSRLEYRFTTVTPDTHALVLARKQGERAGSLRDVFGWNLPFMPSVVGPALFEITQKAGACEPLSDGTWRATLRVSTVGHLLFAHSAYPTVESDAVFFGPDSYRFVRAIRQLSATATRAVDVGCGSGVGGIALAHFGSISTPVVLADINPRALELAKVNAALAQVPAEVLESDVLRGVDGRVDLVISNPPYLVDRGGRAYRHGGGAHGEALSTRIVRESLARLDRDGGGSLLLYTGVAIVEGEDPFLASIRGDLQQSGATFSYEELDPDIFAGELAEPAYRDAERIAAVLLHARVGHDS
ncbi:MAG: SAM-dependent methyltransferase [Polyangiaceae bacterium]|jgi:SAM-dependent methyltransferase|nr:SAM-dependent methyltransferase [Polyangiaceae bacterium]